MIAVYTGAEVNVPNVWIENLFAEYGIVVKHIETVKRFHTCDIIFCVNDDMKDAYIRVGRIGLDLQYLHEALNPIIGHNDWPDSVKELNQSQLRLSNPQHYWSDHHGPKRTNSVLGD